MSPHSINAENRLQTALKHNYFDEKAKCCKQELNDFLELDKAVYFESLKDFVIKMTCKFLRSIYGKAKESVIQITGLCFDFAICAVFKEFFFNLCAK